MRIIDFERAIDALCSDIVIDEMKLRHANVRQVNAHTDTQLIIWDSEGKAFTASKESCPTTFLTDGPNGHIVAQRGIELERDESLDLKFE